VVKRLLAILLLSLLSACTGTPTELPPATPLPRLATTPALEPWVARWIAEYRTAHGSLGFEVEVLPPAAALEAAEEGEVALVVAGLEAPGDWFVTPLGIEGIAVLVNPENSVRSFSLSELAALFAGRVRSWSDLGGSEGTVLPVIPLAGDEIRLRFEAQVMDGIPATTHALLAPSPSAMVSMILANPYAIGYVPLSYSAEEPRIVRVEGLLPGESTLADGTYPLLLEVVAMAPEEPTGPLRDWLVWLQAEQTPDTP
jgi:phosphate transport system substrate-binding protein